MTISHSSPRELLPSDDGFGPIVKIGPDGLEEAIQRLLGSDSEADPTHARRFIRFAHEHEIDLSWLFSRLDDQGGVLLSSLFVPSPGRTSMVFATNPVMASEAVSLSGVLEYGCQALLDTDLELAQSLLEPSESRLRDAFVEAGFEELAMLQYLERPLAAKRTGRRSVVDVQWPSGVTVEPYRERLADELIHVLDASYVDTMDCPSLFGLRRTEDILEGHKASGEFDPSLWTILRIEGRACGAILLNPAQASRAVELVYMGLSSDARGKGLGSLLLKHGLSLLVGRSEHNITLAVDELNTPAQTLYRKAGFRPVLRRRAMIRSLRSL